MLTYIQQETVEIDMGFWMMTDARYSNALVSAWQRGVKIRLLMDPRCGAAHAACNAQNDQLQAAGIPMRNRATSGILHWKVAIFASQGQIEFAGANYAPFELAPEIPYVNFTDEIVYFTNEASVVHSFMRKFDDLWTSTTEFTDYANITAPLTRSFPTYAIDPDINFPPEDSYRARALNAYAAEHQKIDVLMFRITDEQHTNAMLAAMARGVPVRLITDETEYRNTSRLWDAYNVDKMYNAGVQVRFDGHQGINHEKAIILYGTAMSIFGSSNWTSPSSDSQREHNYFTTKPWIHTWLTNQFERKWNNQTGHSETKPFVPLPPDVPVYNLPANNATGVATSGTSLSFYAGLWGHNYDIYFGTTPNPPLLESNKYLGPSQFATDYRVYFLPPLQPGTTYYWKIVSKTMAFLASEGPVWSFRTAGGAPPPNVPPSVTLTSPAGGASFTPPATVSLTATASDSDGSIAKVDFFSGNTPIGTATTAPYAATWSNVAAGTYTLTAVATDNLGAATTSGAVTITVGSQAPLPSGWTHVDIGATGATGDATFSNGTFTVSGAGADVWGTADAAHYAWRSLNGDGTIVARVTSIQNVNAWTKAGVMLRNSASASAAQAFMLVASSATKGVPFQRRRTDGDISVTTSGSQSTAPRWVRLVRAGSLITGSESPDGVTWTTVGSDTFTLGSTVLVGLAVSSHVTGVNATATFDNVSVTATNAPPNVPPTVSLTSPVNGASASAPATFTVTASAADSDGSVATVDFFAGATRIGTVTSAPYTLTWSNVPAGTYSLTAVATDDTGAATTSGAVSVTANTGSNAAPTVALTAPANGTVATAPGSFTVTASAADSDGTVARVDFFAGATPIGTATSAPYSISWSNVAAGAYSLTAVATDNAGATATSSAVSVTVNAPASLPAGWADADIGAVPFPGTASAANGTFSVTGSGADVWGTADAFHYAYRSMTGDGTIIARVTSIQQGVNAWVKAGVMIRDTLDAGSAQAFILVSTSKGVAFQRRGLTGGTSTSSSGSLSTAPRWVKLTRNGNLFTASESADGVNWTVVGTDSIPMGTKVLVGLGVTSHTTAASATCAFDSVTIQ
ncbi:MAG TPA: Ig-like domain-containing protein [Vicinamibacterales bacterium]|nr:Ig-like domain-containing protein [Vicinamibacterales bacterium]